MFDPTAGTSEVVARIQPSWGWNNQLSALDWSSEGMFAPTVHHTVYQGFPPSAISQRALAVYGDRASPRCPARTPPGAGLPAARLARGHLTLGSTPTPGPHHLAVVRSPAPERRRLGRPGRSRYAGTEPGGHDGYVVLPVLVDGFRVEVFDAARVGDGPWPPWRARRRVLPRGAALGVDATSSGVADRERLRFSDELEGHLDRVDERLGHDVVRTVAEELDATA